MNSINSIVGHSLASAAAACNVSEHTVTLAVREGELPARRVGKQAVILSTDLQAWLESFPEWHASSPAA